MRSEQKSDESKSTRDTILDATESIIVEEGCAAVTSRHVAERAGLKSLLIHYHFGTMEELFVAVYERSEREFLSRYLQALTSENPLRALWELSLHPRSSRLSQELMALSNRNKSIRKITTRILEQVHSMNSAFIGKYFEEAGIDREKYPPAVVSHIINGLSRLLVTEEALGLSLDRHEVLAFVERWLGEIEANRRVTPAPGGARIDGSSAERSPLPSQSDDYEEGGK